MECLESFTCCMTRKEKLCIQCGICFHCFAQEFCSLYEIIWYLLKFPGVGAFDHLKWTCMMGHSNGFLAWGGGNLNNNFHKSQMPGGDVEGSIWLIHYNVAKYSLIQYGYHMYRKQFLYNPYHNQPASSWICTKTDKKQWNN